MFGTKHFKKGRKQNIYFNSFQFRLNQLAVASRHLPLGILIGISCEKRSSDQPSVFLARAMISHSPASSSIEP